MKTNKRFSFPLVTDENEEETGIYWDLLGILSLFSGPVFVLGTKTIRALMPRAVVMENRVFQEHT